VKELRPEGIQFFLQSHLAVRTRAVVGPVCFGIRELDCTVSGDYRGHLRGFSVFKVFQAARYGVPTGAGRDAFTAPSPLMARFQSYRGKPLEGRIGWKTDIVPFSNVRV
jgi:hypothetical protein